jgi:peptidoglycan/LPS O-acetylase OafA/YrhL
MWDPRASEAGYGAYEPARTSDEHTDDITLADEADIAKDGQLMEVKLFREDLPLSPEEISSRDPLDARYAAPGENVAAAPRWRKFAQRLASWRRQSREAPLSPQLVLEEKLDEGSVQLVGGASASPQWAEAGQQTVSWLVWPLPSYTHRFFVKSSAPEEPRRPTDYLDGLRGVASLFVFFEHYLSKIHENIVHDGFGYEDNWNIFQLPFVRTVYAGSAMVSIFFIISGYVLSQRCVVAMRANKQEKLHAALTSMTFRRAIRLFLPSLVISLCALAVVFLGLVKPQHPEAWTVWKELENFRFHLFKDLFKLWDWDITYYHWYAPQLWTIPLEFRCSMILFLWILMTARTTVRVRFVMEAAVIAYFFYTDRWDVALFLVGMVIAEINLIADERKQHQAETRTVLGKPDPEKDNEYQPRRRWWSRLTQLTKTEIGLWTMLIVGFYLTGYPDNEARYTPGYSFLTNFWDEDWDYKFRFWLAQSAILVVFAISFLPTAQAFFSTPIARYLGKISYALYLVHFLMNKTVRVFLWRLFWNALEYHDEEGDDIKFEGGWILGSLIYIPIVLWAADIFWRAVDIPTVKFAKWFEGKCFVKERTRA